MMAVVAILLGLIVQGGTAARKRAKIYRTKSMIATLETSLAMYHSDYGQYPVEGSDGNASLVLAFIVDPADLIWKGPYISFKDDDTNVAETKVIDSWKNEFDYDCNTGAIYVIASSGPDGTLGNADDISSN